MSVTTRLLGLVVSIALLVFVTPAHAEELWPESFDVMVQPGAGGEAELVIVNDQSEEQSYSIDLLQVHIGETHEEMTFSSLDDDLASWIILDDDALSLAANTQGTIGLTIAPTTDVDPGLYIIGVQMTRLNQAAQGVGVQTAIVSLGFISVGELEEDYEWLDTSFETYGWSLPVTSSIRVRNEGDRVVIPQGTMRITSLFGREVALEEVNAEGSRVLNGQTRTFTTRWGEYSDDSDQPFVIGIFTVDLEVAPWEGAEVFHARQHIILLPWRTALIALAILGLLAWMHSFSRSKL